MQTNLAESLRDDGRRRNVPARSRANPLNSQIEQVRHVREKMADLL